MANAIVGLGLLAIGLLLVVPPSGARMIRDFDPVRTADDEVLGSANHI